MGFTVIWESDQAANLKLQNGPLVFLKKGKYVTPLKFETLDGEISPVLSLKTTDLRAFHQDLMIRNVKVSAITEHGTGKLGIYEDFTIEDPDNHVIEIGSFPDIVLPEYRGY